MELFSLQDHRSSNPASDDGTTRRARFTLMRVFQRGDGAPGAYQAKIGLRLCFDPAEDQTDGWNFHTAEKAVGAANGLGDASPGLP
jgi:hypothetical protein